MGAKKLELIEYIESKSTSIIITKEHTCEKLTIEICEDYFKKYKEGHEVKGSFADDIWLIKSKRSDMFCEIVFSDLLMNYKEKLKKYAILKLHTQDISVEYLKFNLMYICRTMLETKFFNEEYFEDFKKKVVEKKEYTTKLFALCQFLEFIEEGKVYVAFLSRIKMQYGENRDIPGFQSIIHFNKIVNDVIENHPELIVRHYFILLWWRISTIVPMRPSELINLKRNCVYEKHNEYYLHIDRLKNKYNRKIYKTPVMTEFLITKEIYEFIQKYINYANSVDTNEFLISREVYISTLKNEKNSNHKVNYNDFHHMLERFYDDVVKDIYGLEVVPLNERTNDKQIEKIRLGDTRHVAIINLMMQGINPLEIMKLAGHHNVETQMGYYSHVEKFMTSKTYVLSRLLKTNSTINKEYNKYDGGQKKIEKDLLGTAYYQLPLVASGSGRCKCTNFPYDCESSECIYCKYFLPENGLSKEYINLLEEQNENELQLKRDTLQYLLKNHMYAENSELERASKDYMVSLNQKLVIQSYKLNRKEDSIYEE